MKTSADLPTPRPHAARPKAGQLVLPLALALALSACVSATRQPAPAASASAAPMSEADYQKAAAYWGPRYAANPKDRATALNYAAALRRLDRVDQAVAVLQKAAIYHPSDREVMAAYGKALA